MQNLQALAAVKALLPTNVQWDKIKVLRFLQENSLDKVEKVARMYMADCVRYFHQGFAFFAKIQWRRFKKLIFCPEMANAV
jgi:hypothetical protein